MLLVVKQSTRAGSECLQQSAGCFERKLIRTRRKCFLLVLTEKYYEKTKGKSLIYSDYQNITSLFLFAHLIRLF